MSAGNKGWAQSQKDTMSMTGSSTGGGGRWRWVCCSSKPYAQLDGGDEGEEEDDGGPDAAAAKAKARMVAKRHAAAGLLRGTVVVVAGSLAAGVKTAAKQCLGDMSIMLLSNILANQA